MGSGCLWGTGRLAPCVIVGAGGQERKSAQGAALSELWMGIRIGGREGEVSDFGMLSDSNAARQGTEWATSGRHPLSAQVAPSRLPDARSTTIANNSTGCSANTTSKDLC